MSFEATKSNLYNTLFLEQVQNKAIRVSDDVPILDNINLHYVNLNVLNFPDIVILHTCLPFFDILNDSGPSNFIIPLLSEQHSYSNRNVSSEQLYTE